MASAVQNIPLEKLLSWPYQTERAILVPYSGEAKKQFSQDFLCQQYVRLLREDILDTVFPEGPITLNQFIAYCLEKPVQVLCKNDVQTGVLPVCGFGWLYDWAGPEGARMSKVGFAFYREYWGTPLVRELGDLLLRWWLNECKVDVLYGTMLKTNRLALNFSQRFGFKELCVLPSFFFRDGKRIDGRLVCLERENYRPYYPSVAGRANGHGQGT